MTLSLLFLNQVRTQFLEIPFVHALVCVCLCVCVSALEALITIDVIWYDIGRVQLVKQVSQLFPAFNYFYMTLAVNKMDRRGHINMACLECLQKKTKVTQYQLQKDYWKDRGLHL